MEIPIAISTLGLLFAPTNGHSCAGLYRLLPADCGKLFELATPVANKTPLSFHTAW